MCMDMCILVVHELQPCEIILFGIMDATITGNFKFLCLNEVFNNSIQVWLKGLTDLGPLGSKTFQTTQSKKLPPLSWSYLCDAACVWLYSEPYRKEHKAS